MYAWGKAKRERQRHVYMYIYMRKEIDRQLCVWGWVPFYRGMIQCPDGGKGKDKGNV